MIWDIPTHERLESEQELLFEAITQAWFTGGPVESPYHEHIVEILLDSFEHPVEVEPVYPPGVQNEVRVMVLALVCLFSLLCPAPASKNVPLFGQHPHSHLTHCYPVCLPLHLTPMYTGSPFYTWPDDHLRMFTRLSYKSQTSRQYSGAVYEV